MAAACPCGSGEAYASCCEPLHLDERIARTAEQLMRSRYSAFFHGRTDYLIATLHPSKRRATDRDALERSSTTTEWIALQILDTRAGREGDALGEVEFIATYHETNTAKRLQERSSFVHDDGRWYYVSGEYENLLPLPKPGRNDPCWCGSGKKYKKCHG